MPKYFFHVHNVAPRADDQGEELLDDEAAWREATLYAAAVFKDMNGKCRPGEQWSLEVADGAGKSIYFISIGSRKMRSADPETAFLGWQPTSARGPAAFGAKYYWVSSPSQVIFDRTKTVFKLYASGEADKIASRADHIFTQPSIKTNNTTRASELGRAPPLVPNTNNCRPYIVDGLNTFEEINTIAMIQNLRIGTKLGVASALSILLVH